jgi:hypothetical protein
MRAGQPDGIGTAGKFEIQSPGGSVLFSHLATTWRWELLDAKGDMACGNGSDNRLAILEVSGVNGYGLVEDSAEVTGMRWGGRAGTTFPASPYDGEHFYRTDLDWEFQYDCGRAKWLGGGEPRHKGSGRNGNQVSGYLRRYNGALESALAGDGVPYDATIVGLCFTCTGGTPTGVLHVYRSGVSVATLTVTATNYAEDMTLDDDFDADGVMSCYWAHTSGTNTTPQVQVWYRRRAT